MAGKKKSGGKRKGGYRRRLEGVYHKARGMLGGTKVPLTLTYLGGGAVAEIFGLAPTQRQKLFGGLQSMLQAAGMSYTVNGYTIGAVLVGLKGACSLSPWLHAKVNGFLAGFGFKI